MVELWYYASDESKIGPCSGRELKDLAASGRILPTDTIWKEGIAKGVLATKVKNLFPPIQADVAPVNTRFQSAPSSSLSPGCTPASEKLPPIAALDLSPSSTEQPPNEKVSETLSPPASQPKKVRKARVVGIKGAVIVGQDGTNVKYRKKCAVCHYEDNCWNTMRITKGLSRVGFFCPNCRTRREVQIQGSTN